MNKSLFLLLLFLLFSFIESGNNGYICGTYEPNEAKECFSQELKGNKTKCCYFEGIIEGISTQACEEFPEEYNSQESLLNYIKETLYRGKGPFINLKAKCEGDKDGATNTPNSPSYLKIGLLFILGLLF